MIRYRFLFPSLPDPGEFSRHVGEIFNSGWLSNRAAKVQALENALSERLEIAHVVCVSSATLGLLVLFRALDFSEGSRVLMPAFNFPAPAEAALWNRLVPDYAEIEPVGLTLDPQHAETCCVVDTCALLPVHSLGNLAHTDALSSLADRLGLVILYDGASALGNLLRTKQVAKSGAATVVSLHATKILPAGEGGAILTQDRWLADACRQLINFGMDDRHHVSRYGLNAKMSELNAAFALAGLKDLDADLDRRIELAQAYQETLSQVPWLVPHIDPGAVLQLLPVTVSSEYPPTARHELRQCWLDLGIETRSYYDPPLHTMPAFRPDKPLRLPVTEDICARVICLPFHTRLTTADVAEITNLIEQAGAPNLG